MAIYTDRLETSTQRQSRFHFTLPRITHKLLRGIYSFFLFLFRKETRKKDNYQLDGVGGAVLFSDLIRSDPMKENKKTNSKSSPCAPLRDAYNNCFNRWYAEKFMKGHWDKQECVSEWQNYRACLSQHLEDKHLSPFLGDDSRNGAAASVSSL